MGSLFSCAADNSSNPWMTAIWIVVIIGAFVLMMYFNRRSQKKRQEEATNLLNAIKPGNKVKTIGGICGIVTEVCRDDNTFVLETGTEKSGKSYIKFDMQAIYQTDAVSEKKDEKPAKQEKEEAPFEETKTEEPVAPAEETAPVAEEPAAEEKPVKKTTRKKKTEN